MSVASARLTRNVASGWLSWSPPHQFLQAVLETFNICDRFSTTSGQLPLVIEDSVMKFLPRLIAVTSHLFALDNCTHCMSKVAPALLVPNHT
jgi:hypothetical protein